MKKITIERIVRQGESRISLRFPYDAELIGITRGLSDPRWSSQMKCWHIADSTDIITVLLKAFYGKAYIDYSAIRPGLKEKVRVSLATDKSIKESIDLSNKGLPPLSEKGSADIEKYKRWMESNRYPSSTVRTYAAMMTKFLRLLSPKEAVECTAEDLIKVIEEYVLPNGMSHSFQNQMISSVKKFYSVLYRQVVDPGMFVRPRPVHKLPNVLAKEEVKRILDALTNEKHRVMLGLIYACGLRRSELLGLVPSDIERDRNLLRIRQSKGFKDRIVPISDRVIAMVDSYIGHYKPERYIFEGQYPGERYSATSLEKVMKTACLRAGIRKEATLHWLRHSYATHLLESGTDLRYIQELLGHKSSRTTEIYAHVTTRSIQKIRSPFDDL